MRYSLKILSLFALVFTLVIGSFTGCGKTQETAGSAAETKMVETKQSEKVKDVTLDFVWFTDGVEGKVMQSVAEDYKKDNPNVSINLIEVPFKDLNTKLKTMISGGKPPALARITDTGHYYDFALDITDAAGGDADKFAEQFIDTHKAYYVRNGKVLGIPLDVTVNGMIYNKTLFQKAGVEVPQSEDSVWTWDEFTVAVNKVKEMTGCKYGVVWDFTPHRFSTLLYEFGGALFSEDRTHMTLNDEKGVAALQYFVDLHKQGVIAESVWLGGENPNNLFRAGMAAVHVSGNWVLSNYKDIKDFEWSVTYLPKKEIRSSIPGGKFVMGFNNSGVEDETAKFIIYLSSKDATSKYCRESLFISPRKDSHDLDYAFAKNELKIFINEMNASTPKTGNDWSYQEIIAKISTEYKTNIVEAIMGNKTPKQALDKVVELGDQTIKELKK